MASTYKKGNKIYISWYDPIKGKVFNKSTGMSYGKQNLILAKKFAADFQKKLDEEVERMKTVGIKKNIIQNAFDHFLRNNNDKNDKTIAEYNWFYRLFTKTFSKESLCSIITKLSVEAWLTSLRRLQLQQNTLHTYCKVLKKFLNFLFEYNYVLSFKINKDVIVKPEVKPVLIFSDEDITKLFDGLDDKNENFRTLIYTLFYTGLRPSDIYNIEVKNINFGRKTFQYYSPKSKEYFTVPIHDDLIPVLQTRCTNVEEGRIFDYETINNIGKAFRRYIKAIEIDGKGYDLRTFRKTFISLSHDSGIDLATVSKLAGHKQITTTAKYYTRISLSKQTQELNKFTRPRPTEDSTSKLK